MILVHEALERVLAPCPLMPPESIMLRQAMGRVLAEDAVSRRTQPPSDVSAMDGYAVRASDTLNVPAMLKVLGEAPAGGAHEGAVGGGDAVRIFTGGPVPAGADAIVLQEDTEAGDGTVTVLEASEVGRHIRRAGIDFKEGDALLKTGTCLGPAHLGLLASMDLPWVQVRQKPTVALLATGDELVRAGEIVGPNQIVSSNSVALAALVEKHGGRALDLGIARDNETSLKAMAEGARGADLLVTMGGASVGDYDLVQQVLGDAGLEVDFWKIAMRPGKPMIFGRMGETLMLGLPGNPVSSMVCATLFLVPMLRTMLGLTSASLPRSTAILGADISANKNREDYMRARLETDTNGKNVVIPFDLQDSSVLSLFAHADALLVRPRHAPAAAKGETVEILALDQL